MSETSTPSAFATIGAWGQIAQIVLLPLAGFLCVQLWMLNAEMSRQTQRIDHLFAEQQIVRETVRSMPRDIMDQIDRGLSRHKAQLMETGVTSDEASQTLGQILRRVDVLTREVRRMDMRLDTIRALPPVQLPTDDALHGPARQRPGGASSGEDMWDRIRQTPTKWDDDRR